jgi:hypothetical protein
MDLPPPPMFADVHALLAASRPRPRPIWVFYLAGLALLTVAAAMLPDSKESGPQQALDVVLTLLAMALIAGPLVWGVIQNRARRTEFARLEAAEELVQLRRWPQAAILLQSILSSPARSHQARLQALACFVGVLARFHRFEDVLTVTDHLLQTVPLDSPGVHAVRLSRAMALLREDRLYDADQAISELRRSPEAANSGGLALLELYRDVKTGHASEALELFSEKRDLIRRQFGHRLADAFVLAATAHDQLNQGGPAADAYRTATLLAPAVELHRRYPETSKLAGRYQPQPAPAEVIG